MQTAGVGGACCEAVELSIDRDRLRCRACGKSLPAEPGLIVPAAPDPTDDFDIHEYVQRTRTRYQSDSYASEYLREYRRPRTPSDLYARYVAWRERRTVARCLSSRSAEISTVLDLPAGTGKLAPVHSSFSYRVIAGDVSVQMLVEGIERGEWSGCRRMLGFVQADVMDLRFQDAEIDAIVCLRLMHRLPDALVVRAFEELRRVARKYLIVSTRISGRSVTSAFQRARTDRARFSRDSWTEMLMRFGVVEEHRMVSPLVSSELVSVIRVS